MLRPRDAESAPANAATPFARCLGPADGGVTGRRSLAGGRQSIAGLPLDLDAEADAATELVPNPLPAIAPTTFAPGALPAPLRLDGAPDPALLPGKAVLLPLPPTEAELAPPALPSGDLPTRDALGPATLTDFDPLAVPAAAEAESTPLDAAASQAANATAKTAPAPSWLRSFHRRTPLATACRDAHGAARYGGTCAVACHSAVRRCCAAASRDRCRRGARDRAGRGATQRATEDSRVRHAGQRQRRSASRADWLPPAAGHGVATSTAAAASLPGAPVDLRSPNWHEAFASRVQWLVDTQVGEAHIKLNPPELGAVDVKISLVDDKTYVQLTTATAAARDELANSLPRLRELFTAQRPRARRRQRA